MADDFEDYFGVPGKKEPEKKNETLLQDESWKGMLSGKAGRKALWDYLEELIPTGKDIFTGNSGTFFNCGLKRGRDVLEDKLKSIDLMNYFKMIEENSTNG